MMYNQVKKILFQLEPETAHNLAHGGLIALQNIPFGLALLRNLTSYTSSRFWQNLWGLEFNNPVGLAAGFDKNAKVVDGMSALGFGFLELGSVTLHANEGNEKPRLFRLPKDEALINRLGLNNEGPYKFLENLNRAKTRIPKLVSISKTNDPSLTGDQAISDFCESYRILGSLNKLVVINLSCPNTKDGKTFENKDSLTNLLQSLAEVRKDEVFNHNLLVKFSSDVDEDNLRGLLDIAIHYDINGFVLSNTSNSRDGLFTDQNELAEIGRGGLSGRPIFEKSLKRISVAYQHTAGKFPIIGVGGVSSGQDVVKMIKAGASLVELYTALIYKGPALIKLILEELEHELISLGCFNINELVGSEKI